MKKTLFISAALVGSVLFAGCEDTDFLNQENTTSLNQQTFFDSDEAVQAATAPLYNYIWQDYNSKFLYGMGDGRANNITAQYSDYIYPYTNLNESSLSQGLDGAWGSIYSAVAQSNNTINNIKRYATSGVSESAKKTAIAEARFMRGLAYWYIASLWGVAIIYEDTDALVNNYVVPVNSGVDAIEFAIRDFEYAAAYLPETVGTKGRVTKYAAYGMLSRVYLSMAGLTTEGEYNGSNIATDMNRGSRNPYYLDLAKKAALKVIESSSYDLMDNFGDLFTYENNNCKEAIFQFQWLTGQTDAIGWGCVQQISTFYGWSSMVTDGTNWGGATYCSWDLWAEFNGYDVVNGVDKTDPSKKWDTETIRKHCSVASYGEFYPEMNIKNGGYTYGVTENAATQGTNIKKYVIGTNADNGVSYKQSSGLNTHVLRLAEVYLNLAEAILGNEANTTDEIACIYFNKIRTRAKMPTKSIISYEDIRHERRVEFAFEGQYWFDMVRRSYYEQQEVINYMNAQDRNRSYKYNADTEVYEANESAGQGVATATVNSLTLPVSDPDQQKNPNLRKTEGKYNTQPYQFGEREVSATDLY